MRQKLPGAAHTEFLAWILPWRLRGDSDCLIALELPGADDESGDKKGVGEDEVDDGVRDCVWTAGGAGEIQARSVIHGADVPDGGEESFEGLARAAENAEEKGATRKLGSTVR